MHGLVSSIAMLLVIAACAIAPTRGAAFGADAATKPAATQPEIPGDWLNLEVTRSITPTRVIEVPGNTILLGVSSDGTYAATMQRLDDRWHLWRFLLHAMRHPAPGDRCPECGHPLEEFQHETPAKPNEPSAPNEPRA